MHASGRGPTTTNGFQTAYTKEDIRFLKDLFNKAQPIGLKNDRIKMLPQTNSKLLNYFFFKILVASFTFRKHTKHCSLHTFAALREGGQRIGQNPAISRIETRQHERPFKS